MMKIVECVPNFSEGRRKDVIEAIADAVRNTEGVSLLDVDPGPSTNRTVYTFVGSPDAVVEGALNAAKVAFKLIDMTSHKGEHPRMGALDVCPFIPVRGVTQEECVEASKKFGARLADALDVPVFLYGAASNRDYRKTMPQIRAGEYEGLSQKIVKEEWAPDFGPAKFVPSWGGTVTGVRKFLVAYNINILSTKEQAHRIALNIREQGRGAGQPGRLKNCQAIGWWLDEANLAQVSTNLTDFDVTPIHVAYEEAKKDAEELNLAVTGSEIVGLVPLEAMLQAAEYYINKENLFILDEEQKVHLAINRLGLSSVKPFHAKERIIEYMLEEDESTSFLVNLSLKDFISSVGDRTPAPGGGSVAAAVASLGAGLGAMVGKMTYGKRIWESLDSTMRRLIPPLHNTMKSIVPMIDADTTAFSDYMDAMKLPKTTTEEQQKREEAMEAALQKAICVPLTLAKTADSVWATMEELATVANLNTKSDLQVGAHCLATGIWGAYYNIKINLKDIKDEAFKERVTKEAQTYIDRAESCKTKVLDTMENRNQ